MLAWPAFQSAIFIQLIAGRCEVGVAIHAGFLTPSVRMSVVPFVESEDEVFLKTIIPSR